MQKHNQPVTTIIFPVDCSSANGINDFLAPFRNTTVQPLVEFPVTTKLDDFMSFLMTNMTTSIREPAGIA